MRAARDAGPVETALASVHRAAAGGENTMPAILEAVRAYATVGEISAALGDVFGYHRASHGRLMRPAARLALDHVGIAAETARSIPLAGARSEARSAMRTRCRAASPSGASGPSRALELVVPARHGRLRSSASSSGAGRACTTSRLRVDEPLDGLLERLRAAGIETVGEIEAASDGRPSVFLHPSSTGGVLVELVEGRRQP